jgi:hypothetical protein
LGTSGEHEAYSLETEVTSGGGQISVVLIPYIRSKLSFEHNVR